MSNRNAMQGVDVGGTFTDVVKVKDGVIEVAKVPSYPPEPQKSVLEGARRLNVSDVGMFNHASTKGLNAVLTRNLPKVGFITTDGHRDMLDAGRGWRPLKAQITARWRRPFGDAAKPLVERYLRRGVIERITSQGEVVIPLDEDNARKHFELLKKCDVKGVAICLLNSYRNPVHEIRLKEIGEDILGKDVPISISSETSPLAKEYARASTTLIDVFMKLTYTDYSHQLHQGLSALGFEGELNYADCSASLLPWKTALEQPYQIVFAGPAAGTASCLHLGRLIDEPNLICADVGGTSTDVSLIIGGEPFVSDNFELEFDMVINAISTEISSVGAGGGSIISISSSGDVQVGPKSAGAIPGAACYDRGGDLPTVTDACLLMGIINPKGFADGQLQLREDLSIKAFEDLDTTLSLNELITYAYRIAVNNIAEEASTMAIRHGADPRNLSLVAYGAAGPMLLAGALELTGVKQVIIPPYPGLFSALGLLSTDLVYTQSACDYLLLNADSAAHINDMYETMELKLLEQAGDKAEGAKIIRSFDGRLMGQSWETPLVSISNDPITEDSITGMIELFHQEYERRNGKSFRNLPVQSVRYRSQLIVPQQKLEYPLIPGDGSVVYPEPVDSREIRLRPEKIISADVYDRELLSYGSQIEGPAVITEKYSTTFLWPNQTLNVGRFGEMLITRSGEKSLEGKS